MKIKNNQIRLTIILLLFCLFAALSFSGGIGCGGEEGDENTTEEEAVNYCPAYNEVKWFDPNWATGNCSSAVGIPGGFGGCESLIAICEFDRLQRKLNDYTLSSECNTFYKSFYNLYAVQKVCTPVW